MLVINGQVVGPAASTEASQDVDAAQHDDPRHPVVLGPAAHGVSRAGSSRTQRGDRGVAAGVLPGLDGHLPGDLGHGDAAVLERAGEDEHVVVDDSGPSAVVAAGRGGLLAFVGLLADVVAVELGGDGEDGEEHGAHAVRVVDPGERAGEQFQLDTVGLQGGGQGHQLGGDAGEPFEFVDGQDHRLVRGGLCDVAGQPQRGLELGPDLDPGADLLREDPCAVHGLEGLELAGEVLLGGGAAGVADPDRRRGARRGGGKTASRSM